MLVGLGGSKPQREEFSDEAAYRQAISRAKSVFSSRSAAANRPDPVEQNAKANLVNELRDYRILEKLGEGGMGAVYKAVHTKLDKVVAIKVLSGDRMADQHAVERFHREMKAVGRLEHPNIVRASDAGEVDGRHFLVMQYVQGADLSALVQETGPLPIAEACDLIRQAAEGLQYAHDNGLVHRDIKPSNLMLTHDGRVKVLDLGLALLHDQPAETERRVHQSGDLGGLTDSDLTTAGQLMGTLDYMAPEQCDDSHQVDIRADIYSLGATLYKLLTGRPPFDDQRYDTPMKKMIALTDQSPTPIRKVRPEVPQLLSQVIHRMLAKQPTQRFERPSQVGIALAQFAESADVAGWLAGALELDAEDLKPETLLSVDSAETVMSEPKKKSEEPFDAYHVWLSIAPAEQPPHHYRLLGVQLFESDLRVIESAADRQMSHVRSFQSGKHGKESQKLLNEISAAKLCLLNQAKKKAYDEKLKTKIAAQDKPKETAPPPAPAPAAKPAAKAAPKATKPAAVQPDAPSVSEFTFAEPKRSQTTVTQPHKSPNWLFIGGGAAAAVLLIAIVAFVATRGGDPPVVQNQPLPDTETGTDGENDGGTDSGDSGILEPGEALKEGATGQSTAGATGIGASTNSGSPPNVTPLPMHSSDGSIDLIAHLKNSMDDGNPPFMKGNWEARDGVLQKTTDGVGDGIAIPYKPTGDYRLNVQFVRKEGSEAAVVFLPVGQGYVAAVFANDYAGLGGFKRFDSSDDSNPTKTDKFRIKQGELHNAVIEVRLRGATADVRLDVDGEPLIRQSAPQEEFGMTADRYGGGKPLGISVRLATKFEFTRITVTPLDASGGTASSQLVTGQTVDLIKLLDENISAGQKPPMVGQWEVDDGVLRKTAEVKYDGIELPYKPTGDYRLNVKFVRRRGDDVVLLLFPVGSGYAQVVLTSNYAGVSGYRGMTSGLDSNPTKTKDFRIETGKVHTAVVEVRLRGSEVVLHVEVDGRTVIRRSDAQLDYVSDSNWRWLDKNAIGVGAGGVETIDFNRITVTPLDASGGRAPAQVVAGEPIDLIKYTLDQRRKTGKQPVTLGPEWLFDDGVLRNGVSPEYSRIELPYYPKGSYRLSTAFIRQKGDNMIVLRIPAGAGNVAVALSNPEGWSGLGNVHGIEFADANNTTKTRQFKIVNGQEHTAVVDVRLDGANAEVRIVVDDQHIIQWKGPQTDLSNDRMPNRKAIGLETYNSRVDFERVTIQPLKAREGLATAGTGTVTLPSETAVATGKPIDLIEHYAKNVPSGAHRHGSWGVRDGVFRCGAASTFARGDLPYAPGGNYRFDVTFRCESGEWIALLLPLGSTRVCVHLAEQTGLRNGGFVAKNDPTSVGAAKIGFGQEHHAVASVWLSGEKAEIHVDFDDRPVIRWSGQPEEVKAHSDWRSPRPDWLGLGVWRGRADFTRIVVEPIGERFPVLKLAEADKLPQPNSDELNAAERLIREEFADDIKNAKTTGASAELIARLLSSAAESGAGAAERFAQMKLAYESAAEVGDLKLIETTVAALDGTFKVDALVLRASALSRAVPQLKSEEEGKALADAMLALMANAETAERFAEVVKPLRTAAGSIARKTRDAELKSQITKRLKQSSDREDQFTRAERARKRLDANDNDAAAHMLLGKYLCFVKGDWPEGLDHLAKGSDEQLQQIAAADMGNPQAVNDQIKLGDNWWDHAAKQRDEQKSAEMARAIYWYEKTLPEAPALIHTKIKKRIDEFEKLEGATRISKKASTLRKGLLLHYTFDEKSGSILDHSGNNKHAVNQGAVYNPRGKRDGAYVFDGRDHMVLPPGAISNLPEGTVAMWLYLDRTHNMQFLNCVAKGAGEDIHIQFRTGEGAIVTGYLGSSVRQGSLNSMTTIATQKWTHVAWVWKTDSAAVYIDGRRIAQLRDPNKNFFIPTTRSSFNIGRDARGSYPQQNFLGGIDDLVVFNRPLSATEIVAVARGTALTSTNQSPIGSSKISQTRATLSNGLVLHYPFDKSEKSRITDQSKAKNNGTAHGVTFTTKGKIGSAAVFDGMSHIDCGNPAGLNFGTGDFTTSFWFVAESKQLKFGPILNKGNPGSLQPARPGYALYHQVERNGTTVLRWDFGWKAQIGRARVESNCFEAKRWHHIALIRRSNAIEAYLDGQRITDKIVKQSSDASTTGPESVLIGKSIDNRGNAGFFRGALDDVRIYNRALTPDEVVLLFRTK
jgi:serine/threonine protein kinase